MEQMLLEGFIEFARQEYCYDILLDKMQKKIDLRRFLMQILITGKIYKVSTCLVALFALTSLSEYIAGEKVVQSSMPLLKQQKQTI